MKKILILIIAFICLITFNNGNKTNVIAEENINLNGDKCIVLEVSTGKVLYASNEHTKAFPASMTKMMGMYLVLESIHEGKIDFDDEVTCSEYASSMGGTQIYLEPGEQMKVEELFKAVAINSANDAIVCLGEYIFGDNDSFINAMNKKAKELKMNNTNFVNATGFDDESHYTTPYDMALIGRQLVLDYPEVLSYSSLAEDYIKGNRNEEFWLVNTNKLLKHCNGMDGLKTGYTSKAGYNLTATVKRNGIRVISVVMNEKSIQERSQDTIRLVNYAFSKLKIERLFSKDQVIGTYQFPNSMSLDTNIYLKDDVDIVLGSEDDINSIKTTIVITNIKLPLNQGDIVGKLEVKYSTGETIYFDLIVKDGVEKTSFIKIWINNIVKWIV